MLSTLCIGGVLMSKNEIDAGSLMSFLVSSQVIQKSVYLILNLVVLFA